MSKLLCYIISIMVLNIQITGLVFGDHDEYSFIYY